MSSPAAMGRRVAAAVGLVVAVAGVAAWSAAVWLVRTAPIHHDAATVDSTAAVARTDRYAEAVEGSRRLARALLVGDNVPGLSVAVSIDGELVWAEAFGWSDVENEVPVTPRTRFRLGAASKPLTAAAAALLHDRGRLDLDAPIQRYVASYPRKQWTVTTRQLLQDVAGVHRIRGDNNDAMPVGHCENVDEAVAMLQGDPLLFEPGTQHRYSVWGWVLVSAAIEGAAGESFDRFMTRQVFAPLGMDRTVAVETSDLDDGPARLAPPRSLLGKRFRAQEADRPDYSCVAGGGAFLSTPADLSRFGSILLKPGFLKADTITELQTPARLASGAATSYALGWTVGSLQLDGQTLRLVSHRGSPMGGAVSILVIPDRGVSIAAAANTNTASVHPFALRVAEAFARR